MRFGLSRPKFLEISAHNTCICFRALQFSELPEVEKLIYRISTSSLQMSEQTFAIFFLLLGNLESTKCVRYAGHGTKHPAGRFRFTAYFMRLEQLQAFMHPLMRVSASVVWR